jgi:hypothetical protein
MTKANAIKKLNANGYKVTQVMTGSVIASKGQQHYVASSLNALIKKLF